MLFISILAAASAFLISLLMITYKKYHTTLIDNNKLTEENIQLKETNAHLSEEIYNLKFNTQELILQQKMNQNQLKEYENIVVKMETICNGNFANLSNKALNEQTNSFLKRIEILFEQVNQKHKQQTGDFNKILEPVLQSLEQFKRQTTNLENERLQSHQHLAVSIENMNKLCIHLKEQMKLLTNSSKMSGKWGEIQLKRLLEISGLLKHCDFLEQCSLDQDGVLIRPDILVNLPDHTYITIDAKTPLSSYVKYKESKGEEESKKFKKEYLKGIKAHISSLGSKKYWAQFTTSPTMVIMFLPGEDFWSVALDEDPEVMEYAYNLNVVVTTPLTLIPLLRIISLLWSRYKLTEDAEDLRVKSMAICEHFLALHDLHRDMGKQIENISNSYNQINFIQQNMSHTIVSFRDKYFPSLVIFKKTI